MVIYTLRGVGDYLNPLKGFCHYSNLIQPQRNNLGNVQILE